MIPVELIDYEMCHAFARELCETHGVPACDVEDIGSDAFLLAIRRSWRTEARENARAVAERLMRNAVLNTIDRRNARAERIIREADNIDEGRQTVDDGEPTDDEVVDNDPVGARVPACPPSDDWQNPFWLRLFNCERKELRRQKKKSKLARHTLDVIKEGLKDSRLSLIKANLNISGLQFCAILDFFRMRFALCFQALLAWYA